LARSRKEDNVRIDVPDDYANPYLATALVANDYIDTINRVIGLSTDLNRFHTEINEFLLKKLKQSPDVDLSVLTFTIGLTYAIQILSVFLAPMCPRSLVAFLGKYYSTVSHVVAYIQSGNVNESNTRKYLQKLLDRYHEFSHIASVCLGLPIELVPTHVPEDAYFEGAQKG
jgi:hypothetical protein